MDKDLTDEDLGVFVLDNHCEEIGSILKYVLVCSLVTVTVVTVTLLGVYLS